MKFQFLGTRHELRSNEVICKITEHSTQHNFNFLIVYCKSKDSALLGCYAMPSITNVLKDDNAFICGVKLESECEGNMLDP